MKTRRIALALGIGALLSLSARAEISQVNIKKIGQDLYQTTDGRFIETQSCYVDTPGDNAVLNYKQYACTNHLRFSSDKTCEVVFVFK
jgi:hypothetical protein